MYARAPTHAFTTRRARAHGSTVGADVKEHEAREAGRGSSGLAGRCMCEQGEHEEGTGSTADHHWNCDSKEQDLEERSEIYQQLRAIELRVTESPLTRSGQTMDGPIMHTVTVALSARESGSSLAARLPPSESFFALLHV